MVDIDELLLRLLLVILVGGAVGAEREYQNKSAGLRTMMLICLGSFLFTTFSIAIGTDSTDRIASNIVTGIGFLGGGVIFRSDNRVQGLTTAAAIWAVAALGMGIGDGYYALVLLSTLVILILLFYATKLENLIDRVNQSRNYRIVSIYQDELLYQYEQLFREYHLRFKRVKLTKRGEHLVGSWMVHGPEKAHNRLIEHILRDPTVKEFEF